MISRGALDLRRPFRALERMPLPLALAGLGVAYVEDYGPVAWRPLADVSFH